MASIFRWREEKKRFASIDELTVEINKARELLFIKKAALVAEEKDIEVEREKIRAIRDASNAEHAETLAELRERVETQLAQGRLEQRELEEFLLGFDVVRARFSKALPELYRMIDEMGKRNAVSDKDRYARAFQHTEGIEKVRERLVVLTEDLDEIDKDLSELDAETAQDAKAADSPPSAVAKLASGAAKRTRKQPRSPLKSALAAEKVDKSTSGEVD